ncbi:MAG: sensor domain-containing diguanylate cyclase [Rhodospirillales bacterium]
MNSENNNNAATGGQPDEASSRGGSAFGGALDGFPGAAVVLDHQDSVVAANVKGQAIRQLLARGGLPQVVEAVGKVRDSGEIVLETVGIESSNGTLSLEATVIPQPADNGAGTILVLMRDVTVEQNLRSALIESRQRYKDLVEINSDFTWEVRADGTFVFVSPRGALGYSAKEIVGTDARSLLSEKDSRAPVPFVSKKPLENVETWLTRKNGETASVLLSCVPLFDESQCWQGTRGVCRDVTEERANEAALARARHREYVLNHIVYSIRDEIEPINMLSAAATSTAGAFMASGAQIFRRTGDGTYDVAASHGDEAGLRDLSKSFKDLKPEPETHSIEIGKWSILFTPTLYRHTINGVFAIWRATNEKEWDDDYRILLCDVANQIGIANEQIANHERILALSRTDGMTGLLNRRAFFEEELPRRLGRLLHQNKMASLFYVDLDNFKLVNDVHGHQVGDDAILELRSMLVDHSRPGDVIARLGGDEFAMWLDGMNEDIARERADRLIAASSRLNQYSGSDERPLGISVGLAVFDPKSGETLEQVMARADAAMYAVKRAGKGGVSVAPPYTPSGTVTQDQD